jgi:hypothetical protein
LRPRFRGLAWTAIGIGGALAGVAIAALGAPVLPLATGAFGVVSGSAYLLSPAWRLEVVTDDAGLEIRGRFRLAWTEIVRVVASPSTKTCYVDGGAPAKSLIVPGVGAPAPYDIANKQALYDDILAHVDSAKITTVESLEAAQAT